MGFWSFPFFSSQARRQSDTSHAERDLVLRLFLSDCVCEMIVEDRGGAEFAHITHRDTAPPANPAAVLGAAMTQLNPEIEDRIGDVAVFLDNPQISVVDSRQAKLTHFEGRALSEFGKYQLGGKPISFASHAFGETSEQEAEKRIVGYILEDSITMVLFALGKLAKYTTFCGPWSLQSALREKDGDPEAKLVLHGHFSTLTLANGSQGAVAMRHLPFGTSTLVSAYADEHGLSFAEASSALQSRARITLSRDALPEANSPAAHVGSYLALAPVLTHLKDEISATSDYFEFQRLAGRASSLSVQITGDAIAGLGDWLAALLRIDVEVTAVRNPDTTAKTSALNFLEGMRSGLLKLGNQLYDFSGGHFVLARAAAGSAAGGDSVSRPLSPLLQRLKTLSAQPVTVKDLHGAAPVLCAICMAALAVYAGNTYWLVPIDDQLSESASRYDALLAQPAFSGTLPPPASPAEPVLWARDIMTIAAGMAYDMKLTHIELTAARPGSDPSLKLTGTLPKDGPDNLQLIGKFMSRLASRSAATRRFGDFTFTGAGEAASTANTPDGAAPSGEMQFHLEAKLAGVAK